MATTIASKVVAETYLNRGFESKTWIASLEEKSSSTRQRMVDDLLRQRLLLGKSKEHVLALLGKPPPTAYFREYDLVYWLGPERGSFSIDSEWLVIKFSDDGVVAVSKLVTD